MRSFLFLITLLPNLLAAEPTLRVSPALSLSFSTEKGSLHQLQVKKTDPKGHFVWRNVGSAIVGTGFRWSTLQPEGEYRLQTPSEEWVLVWSDEFGGDRIDFTKWVDQIISVTVLSIRYHWAKICYLPRKSATYLL